MSSILSLLTFWCGVVAGCPARYHAGCYVSYAVLWSLTCLFLMLVRLRGLCLLLGQISFLLNNFRCFTDMIYVDWSVAVLCEELWVGKWYIMERPKAILSPSSKNKKKFHPPKKFLIF